LILRNFETLICTLEFFVSIHNSGSLCHIFLTENGNDLQYVMKLNKILQTYDMRILSDRTKAMTLEGRCMSSANGQIIEQAHSCMSVGCNISKCKPNMELEDIQI
jgi:hypothetical protein